MVKRRFWLIFSVSVLVLSLWSTQGKILGLMNASWANLSAVPLNWSTVYANFDRNSSQPSAAPAATTAQRSRLAESEALLSRGINISRWFAFPKEAFTPAYLDHWVSEAEFKQLAAAGFRHVRLSITPDFLKAMQAPYASLPDRFAYIDRALDWAERNQLAAIVDVHPHNPLPLEQGLESPAYSYLQSLWQELATRYRDRPSTVLFEILNEPQVKNPQAWQAIAAGLVKTIRAIDPIHTLIVPGPGWSGAPDLANLKPVDDPNVIYTFHFYNPFEFTHQGGPWDESLKDLRALPYPFDVERFQAAKQRISNPRTKGRLRNFEWAGYNASKMRQDLQTALDFRRRYQVPIYCGEFGAFNFTAIAADRYRWHQDLTTAFRQEKVGYALFEYRGGFGLVPDHGKDLDTRLLQAIGL